MKSLLFRKSKKYHLINKNKSNKKINKKINKKTKKRNNKNSKTMKKNKTYENATGGALSLNNPYVYLKVTNEMLNSHIEFKKWILVKIAQCNCKADGISDHDCRGHIDLQSNNYLNDDETSVFLLVIRLRTLHMLEQQKINLNDDEFLNNILGFCKLVYTMQNIVCIYDVCLADLTTNGQGKKLFNIIMLYLSLNIELQTNKPILWLGIKITNPNFKQICNVYTSFGFCNPYITNVTPFGDTLDFYIMSLYKQFDEYINSKSEYDLTYAKCIFMHSMHLKRLSARNNEYHIGQLQVTLDKSCLFKLKMLPYLTKKGLTTTTDPYSVAPEHQEHSGTLQLIQARYENEIIKGMFSFETYGTNQRFKMIHGGPESVQTDHRSYTYHSHPIALYYKYQVCIAPPSNSDFLYVLKTFMDQGRIFPQTYNIFHLVCTAEGIYFISLSKQMIALLNEIFFESTQQRPGIKELYDYIENNFEYSFQERIYIFGEFGIADINEAAVRNNIQKYLEWFKTQNKMNFNDNIIEIFDLNFLNWKQVFDQTPVIVSIPTAYGNDFVDADDSLVRDINLLFNNQVLLQAPTLLKDKHAYNYFEPNVFQYPRASGSEVEDPMGVDDEYL